jgi:nucleoside-diphosphate-sugar epimerase
MRVLVTGHHGYIGSVLLPLLVEAGHEAVGVDSDLFSDCTFGPPPAERQWRSIHMDLRDVVPADLEGFEAVIHLGSLSNDPLGDLNPDLTYDINLDGSVRVARAAREAGVGRFLFASSCSNYGAAGDSPLDETAELQPLTPYAISKVRFEEELARLAAPGFTVCSLRNATAYGISPRLRVDLVVNNLVAWAVTTGRIVLQSDGTPWRPLVHVEDIASTFVHFLAVPADTIQNQAFNVGSSEENYRIREVAEIVGEVVPGCEVTFAPGAAPDARNYRVSCGKLERTFPELARRWTVREGARQLADAYRAQGFDRAAFEGPRYKRLAQIRRRLAAGELSADLRWRPTPATPTTPALAGT